jgi:hypothetical protein
MLIYAFAEPQDSPIGMNFPEFIRKIHVGH